VTNEDLRVPLKFYKDARSDGDFDAGIEMALRAILTSPEFLFRVERDPVDPEPGRTKTIASAMLNSRRASPFSCGAASLTTNLLGLAIQNKLHDSVVLEQQTRRMMADPRSKALVQQFRRAMVVSAKSCGSDAGRPPLSGFRRQRPPSNATGD
jgi:hypothetical protein